MKFTFKLYEMDAGFWLCSSFFFSSWGDRMWNFAVGLYLIKLTPGSLQLTAIYGAVVFGTIILFAPSIGSWIDRSNRLFVMRTLLLLQNGLIICSALFISLILFRVTSDIKIITFFKVMIIFFGAAANLAFKGEEISISRDWVVVICQNNKDKLTKINAQMRRIDLTVAIIAPIAIGSLMSWISDLSGIGLICGWNILSVFSEYLQLRHVHNIVPELTKKLAKEYEPIPNENEPYVNESINETRFTEKVIQFRIFEKLKFSYIVWKIYRKQSVFLAGVALAVLCLTALGFSSITVGYAYSQSVKEIYVSILFGSGALSGIFGTFLFPFIRNKLGLVKCGVVALGFECTMLLLCVASIWAPGSPSNLKILKKYETESSLNSSFFSHHQNSTKTQLPATTSYSYVSIYLLMVGIVLSRAGLWMFDLTITQLQQENVEEEHRGVVGGVQFSFNSILNLMQYILTMVFFKPEDFGILILISFGAVFTSFIIYIVFSIKTLVKSKLTSTIN
nr:solute carrier family 40 protein member 1 [Hydra vulgaris]